MLLYFLSACYACLFIVFLHKTIDMNVQEIIEYFGNKKWAIRCGANKIAKDTHSDVQDVITARNIVRKLSSNHITRKTPKILIFDIETSPMKAYVWKRWKENISLDQLISDWYIICWSAKWLYSDEVMGDRLTAEEVKGEDDSRVVRSLYELINQSDIVVTHNGEKFDIPRINARFITHGLSPTSPYYSIDTCKIARKQFGFSSNKLNALATYFHFDHKLDTSFELWKKCVEGDEQALNYMLIYNKRDVTLLEEVFIKLRPWIKGGPNIGTYLDSTGPICCKCGNNNLKLIDKFYYTTIGKYKLYRCKSCGAISRGRKNIGNNIETTIIQK